MQILIIIALAILLTFSSTLRIFFGNAKRDALLVHIYNVFKYTVKTDDA